MDNGPNCRQVKIPRIGRTRLISAHEQIKTRTIAVNPFNVPTFVILERDSNNGHFGTLTISYDTMKPPINYKVAIICIAKPPERLTIPNTNPKSAESMGR